MSNRVDLVMREGVSRLAGWLWKGLRYLCWGVPLSGCYVWLAYGYSNIRLSLNSVGWRQEFGEQAHELNMYEYHDVVSTVGPLMAMNSMIDKLNSIR